MVAITTVGAGLVEQAASTAMEWTIRAEASDVGPHTVDHLDLVVSGMAGAYQYTAPTELFPRVWAYRQRVAELLDGRQTLRQRRDLYRLAGRLSILLGWLSHDLGDPLAAEAHCLDAWEHGWQAEDGEVCGWAMDTAASIAMYGHRPDRALSATERGLAHAPARTPVAVRLACQLTRAYGRLGDRDRFDLALASTRDQLDQLSDRGHGLFSVDAGRVASYAATSSIWLDRPGDAVRCATDALGYYTTSAPADRSPTREAIARLDLGLALIATRAPDGAAEATRLALDSDRITDAVLTRAGDVDTALLDAYPELPETRDVHDAYLGLVDRRRAGRELTA